MRPSSHGICAPFRPAPIAEKRRRHFALRAKYAAHSHGVPTVPVLRFGNPVASPHFPLTRLLMSPCATLRGLGAGQEGYKR